MCVIPSLQLQAMGIPLLYNLPQSRCDLLCVWITGSFFKNFPQNTQEQISIVSVCSFTCIKRVCRCTGCRLHSSVFFLWKPWYAAWALHVSILSNSMEEMCTQRIDFNVIVFLLIHQERAWMTLPAFMPLPCVCMVQAVENATDMVGALALVC